MPELGRVKKSVRDERKYNPKRSGAEPEKPEELTDEEFLEWERICNLLRNRKMLDALDQSALLDMVVCWSRLRQCEADITARGVLVQGDRGLVKNPSIQIARTYRDALVAWSKEFGLTVGSRTRLAIGPDTSPKANRFANLGEGDQVIEQALCDGPTETYEEKSIRDWADFGREYPREEKS